MDSMVYLINTLTNEYTIMAPLLPTILLSAMIAGASCSFLRRDPVAATWYAGWHADDFPLSKMPWKKYTHVTYSFAETTPDVHKLDLDGSKPELLPEFVKTAKENGVKALVSIGGWTGSIYFSSAVATAANRTAFAKTVLDLAEQYQLDGLDFDWEYPGNQGIGCNTISPSDTKNFLSFLQILRASDRGSKLILTAATPLTPWRGPDENPLTYIAPHAELLDYVALMNYDVWGGWSETTGPNAPLDDACAPEAAQVGSAASAVAAWTLAGFPPHKVVLAVPAYGRGFSVNATSAFSDDGSLNLYTGFNSSNTPVGDRWSDGTDPEELDVCGNPQGNSGSYNYWGLVEAGYISANGTVAPGVKHGYDECSQTAMVYDESKNLFVTYDNPRSFKAKGAFLKEYGLRGFALWEAGGDADEALLDAIREGASFN